MRFMIFPLLALVVPALAAAEEAPRATPAQQVLAEVNATRATRGLPPFQLDENLARAAESCAAYRARYLMEGHTSNDFQFLPAGVMARASGCAAWPVGMGWGACCTYDGYQYAGAGCCIGPDGRRYMQLFVR